MWRGPRPPYIRTLMDFPMGKQEPASPASPEAAPDTGDAEAVGPVEKARQSVGRWAQKPRLKWALKTPISIGWYNSYPSYLLR